jgi:hypothetical protein
MLAADPARAEAVKVRIEENQRRMEGIRQWMHRAKHLGTAQRRKQQENPHNSPRRVAKLPELSLKK